MREVNAMRILLSGCLLACGLYGQAGKIVAPSSGYVFDPSAHTLRRIQGIPGASLIGAAVDFGFPVSAANVAPRLDSALVLASGGTAHLFRLTADGAVVEQTVEQTVEGIVDRTADGLLPPLRMLFSPSGSSAALYSPGSVQVLKGLPDAPALAATIDLRTIDLRTIDLRTNDLRTNDLRANDLSTNDQPTNDLRANPPPRRPFPDVLAISDDGAYLLYSAGGPIELIGVAGDSRKLMDSVPGVLAAFAPGGHDAAVIHRGALILIQDVTGSATERSFSTVAGASALAYSPDARRLFVASASGRSVTTLDVATGDRASTACDCAPAALIPMGPVFRLNELGSEPLWLLDTASDRGLLFVPPPAAN
jgi:hypothetical protein